MIKYNKKIPLIIIHIPKTAGVSCREIYSNWFEDKLYFHYNSQKGLPHKLSLSSLESGSAIYGHFNRGRGFGIDKYYPEAKQFVTILRNPLELHISRYFFIKKRTENFKKTLNVQDECSLECFLTNYPSVILDHFPRNITKNNYKYIIEKYFIEIGIVEKLDESLSRISKKLGFNYLNTVPVLNTTKRNIETNEISNKILERFIELHELEYLVYNYILKKYT